nr:hypothetical protein [Bacillota bacterium]
GTRHAADHHNVALVIVLLCQIIAHLIIKAAEVEVHAVSVFILNSGVERDNRNSGLDRLVKDAVQGCGGGRVNADRVNAFKEKGYIKDYLIWAFTEPSPFWIR